MKNETIQEAQTQHYTNFHQNFGSYQQEKMGKWNLCAIDAKDITPLTPNHFLHGQKGGEFAPEHQTERFTFNERWKYVQKIIGNVWRRWIKEWIPSIGKRNKGTKQYQNIDVGQVVLVLGPDLPRMKWPLGKIVDAIQGKDGLMRVVKVILQGKIYTRGLNTIHPLYINENI